MEKSSSAKLGLGAKQLGTTEGTMALLTPYFRCLASGMMREQISVVLRHQVCDHLLQLPQKTDVVGHLVSTGARSKAEAI